MTAHSAQKKPHPKTTRHEPQALPASGGNGGSSVPAVRRKDDPESNPTAKLIGLLVARKDEIARRLDGAFTVDAMISIVATSIQQNPMLLECTPASIIGAVYEASQVGLRPDSTLGQCYLVPYWNGKRNCREAKLILGYRGLIALAEAGGTVTSVVARVVYEKDRFVYRESVDGTVLEHTPTEERDRGEPRAVYCIIRKRFGPPIARVMWWWEILEVAERQSQGKKDSPWTTHVVEMGRKTVVRRELKYVPMAPASSRVMQIDELGEEGIDQGLSRVGRDILGEGEQRYIDDKPTPPPLIAGAEVVDDDDGTVQEKSEREPPAKHERAREPRPEPTKGEATVPDEEDELEQRFRGLKARAQALAKAHPSAAPAIRLAAQPLAEIEAGDADIVERMDEIEKALDACERAANGDLSPEEEERMAAELGKGGKK
jgi:recombination protein RecT